MTNGGMVGGRGMPMVGLNVLFVPAKMDGAGVSRTTDIVGIKVAPSPAASSSGQGSGVVIIVPAALGAWMATPNSSDR
jgi:hypothetical protein